MRQFAGQPVCLTDGDSQKSRSQVEINELKRLTGKYKELVWEYKLSPSNKAIVRRDIEKLKESLSGSAIPTDRDVQALREKKEEYGHLAFAFDTVEQKRKEQNSAQRSTI